MRTNKEKYDVLRAILKTKCQEYIRTILPVVPDKYYAISTDYTKHKDGYFIEERPVKEVVYANTPFAFEKPTREDIKKLTTFLDSQTPMMPDHIFIHWQIGNTSGGSKFLDIGSADSWLAWTPEPLMGKLASLIEQYSHREGYLPCDYCRKQRKLEDLHQSTIISPNWKSNGFRSPPRNYCKDGPCATHDQFAHEG